MNDTFLYTMPQWLIFSAVFVSVYGWVEKKKVFRIIGSSLFLVLGIFSIYIISGDFLAGAEFLTPGEVADSEINDEIIEEIPFQAKLLPAYLSFVVAALLGIPALVMDILDKRQYKFFLIISGLSALLGFFIIVGVIQHL